MFKSTAIYPNRIEDKIKLEQRFRLSEQGNSTTEFYYKNHLITKGYTRVVYGDHGPYVEFEKYHFQCTLFNAFGPQIKELPEERTSKYYYLWLCPAININPVDEFELSIKKLNLKVYWQIKPVTNLPNAPKREDGKKSNFNRLEGYADYKRDFYYINPYDLNIKVIY